MCLLLWLLSETSKLAPIFLSHIFLSTFGCGMTALGYPRFRLPLLVVTRLLC